MDYIKTTRELYGKQFENNNIIHLTGKIISDFEYSHQVYGESFYCFKLECKRLSDTEDILPVTISERLIITENISVGSTVEVQGQLRSYNNYVDGKTHLMLTVFAKDIAVKEDDFCGNPNEIKLTGFICKEPVYRKTPFGREIADVLLAVNRAYNKSDYIPLSVGVEMICRNTFCENNISVYVKNAVKNIP